MSIEKADSQTDDRTQRDKDTEYRRDQFGGQRQGDPGRTMGQVDPEVLGVRLKQKIRRNGHFHR